MKNYNTHKTGKKNQGAIETCFVMFVIFTLAVYPVLLPLCFVKADDSATDQAAATSSPSPDKDSSSDSATSSKDSPTKDDASSDKSSDSTSTKDATDSSSSKQDDSKDTQTKAAPASDDSSQSSTAKNDSPASDSAKDSATSASADQASSDATSKTDSSASTTSASSSENTDSGSATQPSDQNSNSADANNSSSATSDQAIPASDPSATIATSVGDTGATTENSQNKADSSQEKSHDQKSNDSSQNGSDAGSKKTDADANDLTGAADSDHHETSPAENSDGTIPTNDTNQLVTNPNNALVESASGVALLPKNDEESHSESPTDTTPDLAPDSKNLHTNANDDRQLPIAAINNENKTDASSSETATSDTGDNAVGVATTPEDPTQTDQPTTMTNPTDPTSTDNIVTTPNNGLVANTSDAPIAAADTSSVQTGDSSADSTLVNVVNTNIVADNYDQTVTNITGNNSDDINLLEQFQTLLQKGVSVDDATKALNITNDNVAKLENEAVALANTGNNTIDTTADPTPPSQATVATGDASATTNIVNVVNQNIVGNSWLFAIINVLGVWSGNLILPGQDLLTTPATNTTTYNVTNNNSATVDNTATATATTGNNSVDGAASAAISTGDAQASSNVQTVANTNITKNNWFFLMINNMGNWTGEVLGWDNATQSDQTLYTYDFGSSPDGFTDPNSATVNVTNTNSATISNTADAEANTGNNSIASGASGILANITTGAANAKTNIFNLINTNIVGNNWMFAIVNIMGSWTGNAVFAYPDMAISINTKNDNMPSGTSSTFDITYENIGKAASDDSVIDVELPKGILSFSDGSSSLVKNLDGLQPGEQKTIEVTAEAAQIDQDEISSEVSANISTKTTEKDLSNNSAEQSVTITNSQTDADANSTGNVDDSTSSSDKLKITRKVSTPQLVSNGEILAHSITVKNSGSGNLYGIVIHDSIVDPAGNSTAKYQWPIGELKKGKAVMIQYQILVAKSSQTGTYENTAKGYGYTELDKKISSNSSSIDTNIDAQFAQNATDNSDQIIPAPAADNGNQDTAGQILGADNYVPKNHGYGLLLFIFLMTYSTGYGVNESIKKQGSWRKLLFGKI